MTKKMTGGFAAAGTLLLASVTAAGDLLVDHVPGRCAVAGKSVRVEAGLSPEVREARVRFRAEGAAAWYATPMTREGARWVAILPGPVDAGHRFAYFIEATGDGARVRAPRSSAYLVDVADGACPAGALPASETAPSALLVPSGASRQPEGFGIGGVTTFLALETGEPALAEPLPVVIASPVGVGARVRLRTRGGTMTGTLEALDDTGYSLSGTHVDYRDVTRVEIAHDGSTSRAVIGGLAGAAAGFAVGILICASGEGCESATPVWIATGAGTALGAGLAGGTQWEPVTLARSGRMALQVAPRPRGTDLALAVGF